MSSCRTSRFTAFAFVAFSLATVSLQAQQSANPLQSVAPTLAPSLAFAIPSGDFTLKLDPSVFSATTRQNGIATITITPVNGFNSPVTFSCSGLPTGAACGFTPATVTPSGAPITTTLTVSYTKPVASLRRGASPVLPASALACTVLFLGWKRRRSMIVCLFAASLLGLCAGCGTDNQSLHTYTVTLTASSSSAQHSTTFLLTVE